MPRRYRRASKSKRPTKRRRTARRGGDSVPSTRGGLSVKGRTLFDRQGANMVLNSLQRYNLPPFPAKKSFVLTYVDVAKSYDCGVAGIGGTENVYRLNSLYDPDLTGAGHQPMYRDQLAALYATYRVTHVEVAVRMRAPALGTGEFLGQFQPSTSTYTLTGQGFYSASELGNSFVMNSTTAPSEFTEFRSGKLSLAKLEGLTEQQYRDRDAYSAAMGANPSSTPYLRLAQFDVGGNNANAVVVEVALIYYGYAYDRIEQSSS